MTTTRRGTSSFFKDLTSLLTGQLVLPEDAAYDQVRQIWSGKVNKQPAALVCCANAQDVVHTLRWARSRGLALSVRGGGHDFAGRAVESRYVVPPVQSESTGQGVCILKLALRLMSQRQGKLMRG
jgi:FAD/FMN-containing dehydrogenase